MVTHSIGGDENSDGPTLFAGPRGLAVKILTRVEQSGAYLDKLLDFELHQGTLIPRDRRLLTELATGVIRWQGRLDWVLTGFYHGEYARCLPIVRNALRVALYQVLFLDRIPHSAAVNESVSIVRRLKGARAAGMVNGVLRGILRKLDGITWPDINRDAELHLSVMHSHPRWMVRRWLTRFGVEQTTLLLEANNRHPALTVRPNPARATLAEIRSYFEGLGLTVHDAHYCTGLLEVEGLGNVGNDPGFLAGTYSVQDEASYIASLLASAVPGQRVIDLCAAPGGKATAIAEQMQGNGMVVAIDRYEARTRLVKHAAQRLGLETMIDTRTADARTVELEPADVVLVDAPCSGLGVLARKPDIRWRRTQEQLATTSRTAGEILSNAAGLVRPGGHLVYTTCTIEPEENERVVERFLEDHAEFAVILPNDSVPVETRDGDYVATLPHVHHVDGMFGAVLSRLG